MLLASARSLGRICPTARQARMLRGEAGAGRMLGGARTVRGLLRPIPHAACQISRFSRQIIAVFAAAKPLFRARAPPASRGHLAQGRSARGVSPRALRPPAALPTPPQAAVLEKLGLGQNVKVDVVHRHQDGYPRRTVPVGEAPRAPGAARPRQSEFAPLHFYPCPSAPRRRGRRRQGGLGRL